MFNEISEGVKRYRLELVAYLIWLEKTIKEHGGKDDHMGWGHHDFLKAEKWNAKLVGMEQTLGLSKEEDATIMKEAKEIIAKLKKEEGKK